jgi:co-chaperonin GroES (HSP10)
MSKKLKLTDLAGEELNSVPSVSSVRPVGAQILVEFLSAQEALGTKLLLDDKVAAGAPQGYVMALGPKVEEMQWGLKVGDRVLCSGSYTPCPEAGLSKSGRMLGLVEPHVIKAVLEENA